jgi:hypothetical protein
MGMLKTLVRSLYRSATSTEYYYHIIQTNFRFTLKFFVGFCVLAAALSAINVYQHTIIPLKPLAQNIPSQLAQVFPSDTEITIINGQVSINQPEPYVITLDQLRQVLVSIGRQVLGASSYQARYLLVVDTEATLEDYYRYQTLLLLTKDSFIYRDPGQSLSSDQIAVKVIPLPD